MTTSEVRAKLAQLQRRGRARPRLLVVEYEVAGKLSRMTLRAETVVRAMRLARAELGPAGKVLRVEVPNVRTGQVQSSFNRR